MWRSTACFAVCAASRLKSSAGSCLMVTVPSGATTRLLTSSPPVAVSSLTLISPGGLKALTYATARADWTVCSISSKGMPTSAHNAVRASARLSVDGSDGEREPGRDNVIPSDVDDHRRAPPCARRRDRDARIVDCDELPLDDSFRLATPVVDVDAPAVETVVVSPRAERALGTRRRDLQVVGAVDELRMVEQRTGDKAHALAVLDGDRLSMIDGDAKGAPGMARLFERI